MWDSCKETSKSLLGFLREIIFYWDWGKFNQWDILISEVSRVGSVHNL